MEQRIVDVENVSIKFNLSSEKIRQHERLFGETAKRSDILR